MVRVGTGFDAHKLVEGRKLILGGVEIDHPLGLEGHSDADVLVHAIIDALLGAIADGDIGAHFPDTDEQWKGADSMDLLKSTAERLKSRGAQVGNVDSTVIAEEPKLQSHIQEMREKIASVLGVDVGFVSVKATTVEKMGALGRGEGIAAMAVATVEQA